MTGDRRRPWRRAEGVLYAIAVFAGLPILGIVAAAMVAAILRAWP